jgi:broad specificity phosphatase PhoE
MVGHLRKESDALERFYMSIYAGAAAQWRLEDPIFHSGNRCGNKRKVYDIAVLKLGRGLSMRLIFVRHGLSNDNILGKIEGHNNSGLSRKGKAQAKAAALKLKDVQIDAIYSSDLERARETAKEIARYHKTTHITFTKQLRERNWGAYEGRSLSGKEMQKWKKERDIPDFEYKSGETLNDVYNRIKNFVGKASCKNKKTVVLVGHGYIGRVLTAIILGKPASEVEGIPDFSNASISVFETLENGRHRIHTINDVAHLV